VNGGRIGTYCTAPILPPVSSLGALDERTKGGLMTKKETTGGAPAAAPAKVAEHAATWTPEDPATCTTCKLPVDDRTVHTTLHVGSAIDGEIDGVQTPDPISDPSKQDK
jgi:hypothetical protein